MGSVGERARETWQAFRRPELEEERRAARAVWGALPDSLRTPDQALGRHSAGCAATYGIMEACDFYCTACYLADEANHTPPLSFEAVKAQLDRMRRYLGPWGNAQISSGEVTLLPCDDLVRIIRYARAIELSPMLMTNGRRILEDPSYLERLVNEAGLDKIAIHIDTTEKGRPGLKKGDREADIHWIRDAFARLVRETRRRTGRPLAAAQTFTVTDESFDDVPDVMRWMARNADAFRMISFQPTASVGRTRAHRRPEPVSRLWEKIDAGLGAAVNPSPFLFGHPECNQVSLSFVVCFLNGDSEEEVHLLDVARKGVAEDARFFRTLLNKGFQGFSPDGEPDRILLARILGRIARRPRFLPEILGYCASRTWGERSWIPRLVRAALAGRRWYVKPLVVVVHNFMSADDLATPLGQERLAACAFRVPVDGRMVSMCELNGTALRAELNRSAQERLVQLRTPG